MKRFFKLTWMFICLLARKTKRPEDYYNFWLILFCGKTIEEELGKHKDGRDFYASNIVKNWQYEIWKWWAISAVRRERLMFFWERKFTIRKTQLGFISWWTPSREDIRRRCLDLWLNAAPTVYIDNKNNE
jgi:hypothetical protein